MDLLFVLAQNCIFSVNDVIHCKSALISNSTAAKHIQT